MLQAPDVLSQPVVRWLGLFRQPFFFSVFSSIFLFFLSLLLSFFIVPEYAQSIHMR